MHFLFKMYLIKIIRQEERHMIRILIVEDEKPISNLIRLSLTKAGYHCTCCLLYTSVTASAIAGKIALAEDIH